MPPAKKPRPTGRPRNADRQTPYTDEWLATVLAPALEPYGARRQLAEHLAGPNAPERSIASHQNTLTKIFRRSAFPNCETVLAIQAWLAKKDSAR